MTYEEFINDFCEEYKCSSDVAKNMVGPKENYEPVEYKSVHVE